MTTSKITETGKRLLLLKGSDEDGALSTAIRHAFGLSLPCVPNTATTSGEAGRAILWLGPEEFLLVLADGDSHDLTELEQPLPKDAVLTDVSDGWHVIALTGMNARITLMQGCTLDFHPRAFNTDTCAQSYYMRAPVLIHQTDDEPTFHIYVPLSFSGYVQQCLNAAMDLSEKGGQGLQ